MLPTLLLRLLSQCIRHAAMTRYMRSRYAISVTCYTVAIAERGDELSRRREPQLRDYAALRQHITFRRNERRSLLCFCRRC